MKISNRKVVKYVITILIVTVFSYPLSTFALTASQLKAQQEYYAQQAAAAKAQAAAKAAQAAQIKQQIGVVSGQISQTQSAINLTAGQISGTETKIAQLEADIKTQEGNLATEQNKFSDVVASWYMTGQPGFFEAVVGSSNFSDVVDQQQYLDSVKNQIQNEMDKIKQLKIDLGNQKTDQQNQLASLSSMKQDQISQASDLAQKKSVQNQLLTDANGAIVSLNQQAADAEARIAQLQIQIRALSQTKNWGDQIISSSGGLSVPNYYQTGNQTHLGNSPYTVSLYGCLVTSIAMVAGYYGSSATPTSIASDSSVFNSEGYMSVNTPPGIGVTVQSSRTIDWSVVDQEISNGHPVIVSILIPSVGKINSDGSSHFIVIKGKSGSKYLMNDPIGDGRGYDTNLVKSMKLVTKN